MKKQTEQHPVSARLDEMYRILSAAETRELTRYLSSPYFNRDKSLMLLHGFFAKGDAARQLGSKSKAWKAVFKKEKYSEKKFRYLVSDLLALIEEFVYTRQVLKKKPGYIHLLDEYYSVREANTNKAALAAKIKSGTKSKHFTSSPEFYLEEHYEKELLEELHAGSLKVYSRYVSENRTNEPHGLDAFYLIEKLRQMCRTANDNNIFGMKVKCYFQNEALELAEKKEFRKNPFVSAYLSVHHMLTRNSEQHYFTLKKLLDDYGYEMEDKNLAELFTYARNFCISKINAGQSRFYREIFDLYEQGLSKRVLLLNGEINERNFKNIVTTGLRIGKQQWVFDFINEYRYKLNRKVRDNAFNYNLANYFFHSGQHDKALQNLQKVQLQDLFYGLDVRSLMLKCYYELDEREAFFNAYESFGVFVQRKKNVSEQHRRNYLNFLRLAKKLMNLRPHDKKNIQKIQDEIKNQKALADKNWLEEKVKIFSGG